MHAEDEALLDVARKARPSVVRIVWRDDRFPDRTSQRNGIVVRADGLLVMAGPPPALRGTFTARFSDGTESRARFLARDTETALSLLQVDRTKLPALTLRGEEDPNDWPRTSAVLRAPKALAQLLPPLGLRTAMVTGDGAVAFGPIRAHGRHGVVTDPETGKRVPTTGLVAASLAALDEDAGSPLLDAEGHVVGLLAGRRDAIVPSEAAAAARRGLRQRPTCVEAVAVPASVVGLVWPLLERHKRVPRVALDITTRPIEADLAQHLRLQGGHVIRRLIPAGRGQRQGLQVHDVIVAVDGSLATAGTTLHDMLLPFRPGAELTLAIVRKGKPLQVPIRTGER